MPGPTPDFTVKAGDGKIIDLDVMQADGVTPQPLTGISGIFFEAAPYQPAPVAATVVKGFGTGVSVMGDAMEGKIRVMLTPADTTLLGSGTMRHEIRIVDSFGNPTTVFYPRTPGSAAGWHWGTFVIEPQFLVPAA
jgi:hypothetical protein